MIIADASVLDSTLTAGAIAPELNGRIYRLGNRVEGTVNGWELMPGFDLDPIRIDANGVATTAGRPIARRQGSRCRALQGDPGGVPLNDIQFFVVGRSLDPNAPAAPCDRARRQDVTAYSTFVSVK